MKLHTSSPQPQAARRVAGLQRAEALAKGGQQAQVWRAGGVKASRTVDRRKRADKRACRGPVRW